MFKFVAIAAALVLPSLLVHASPLTPATELTTIASTFPVHDLVGEFIHPNVTISKDSPSARSLAARQEFPATLLLCPSTNCATCNGFNLASFPHNECFSTTQFISVAISQPSGNGLPFAVGVGPAGCGSFTNIPVVNECFNVNGPAFSDFALFS